MESGWFVVIGAMVGAIVGAVPTVVIGWLKNRAEKETQLRQMALELALADRKNHCEINSRKRGQVAYFPPTAFIASAYVSVREFMSGKLRPEDIEDKYARIAETVSANGSAIRDHINPK